MARKGRQRLRRLVEVVAESYPRLDNPAQTILARCIAVDGRVVDNPASLVRSGAAISLVRERQLRGEAKLAVALARFDVSVAGRVALDLGAAAGGFTRVLLRAGAERVYAVDAGFGQLLGMLRQDPRVVNLERTNMASSIASSFQTGSGSSLPISPTSLSERRSFSLRHACGPLLTRISSGS